MPAVDPYYVPSKGEIVHYLLPRSGDERAAVVTRHRTDGTLDLHVMTCAKAGGGDQPCFNVHAVKRDRSGTARGTWHNLHSDVPRNFSCADVTPESILPPGATETGTSPAASAQPAANRRRPSDGIIARDASNLPSANIPQPSPADNT